MIFSTTNIHTVFEDAPGSGWVQTNARSSYSYVSSPVYSGSTSLQFINGAQLYGSIHFSFLIHIFSGI